MLLEEHVLLLEYAAALRVNYSMTHKARPLVSGMDTAAANLGNVVLQNEDVVDLQLALRKRCLVGGEYWTRWKLGGETFQCALSEVS